TSLNASGSGMVVPIPSVPAAIAALMNSICRATLKSAGPVNEASTPSNLPASSTPLRTGTKKGTAVACETTTNLKAGLPGWVEEAAAEFPSGLREHPFCKAPDMSRTAVIDLENFSRARILRLVQKLRVKLMVWFYGPSDYKAQWRNANEQCQMLNT